MRRHVTEAREKAPALTTLAEEGWLDLEALCTVEVSSEDEAYPVEGALVGGSGLGWRAGAAGEQVIRLRFDVPQPIERIVLSFVESEVERTQEIAVSCAVSAEGGSVREVRRQRWNFSPGGSTTETEDWRVDLAGVTTLELSIVPDVSRGEARASLATLRLA